MQDAFAYCAELLRAADRDRFIASLFAPADRRGALQALYAFNVELARVREAAHAALPGEIRLQWWREVVEGARAEEAGANPVASALVDAIGRYDLPPAKLIELIEARRFDLYDDPMAGVAELETYVRKTSSVLISLAARVLTGGEAHEAAEPAGIAYGIAGLLRAFPMHAARGQLYLPLDVLERHGVRRHEIFAGRSSSGLAAALADLRALAKRHLAEAHAHMRALPPPAIPALLPVALVRPLLARLGRSEPIASVEIPAWRRQWIMWRAARNPARIAR